MIQTLFSVLIANYNNGKFFEDCWNSLLKQTYKNWEAIVVDDCSTDNSVEIIKNIVQNDPRVKIFTNEKNCGCGYTKKKCAELASGELMGFLDPDDTLYPNALSKMTSVFSENSRLVLAYSKHIRCDDKLKRLEHQREFKAVNTSDIYYFNLGAHVTAFSAFKSSVYKNTEGIDAYLLRAVDQDLYLKMFEQGETLFVDEALYNYRIHENGISSDYKSGNINKAEYWQWVVISNAARRRGIIVEELFIKKFVDRKSYDILLSKYNLIQGNGVVRLFNFLKRLFSS